MSEYQCPRNTHPGGILLMHMLRQRTALFTIVQKVHVPFRSANLPMDNGGRSAHCENLKAFLNAFVHHRIIEYVSLLNGRWTESRPSSPLR